MKKQPRIVQRKKVTNEENLRREGARIRVLANRKTLLSANIKRLRTTSPPRHLKPYGIP